MKQNQLKMIQNNHLLNWGKATLLFAGEPQIGKPLCGAARQLAACRMFRTVLLRRRRSRRTRQDQGQ